MNSLLPLPLLFILTATLLCCSPVKEQDSKTPAVSSDTTEIINSFIYGLWSMDSGNTLVNNGFYFKNDGTVDFVASEATGNWILKGSDSLEIKYNSMDQSFNAAMRIDSLSDSRMVLSDSEGVHVYRKVPFGMNLEGMVIQGFSGYLGAGQSKEYTFEMPPVKKILLKMICPDSSVTFRLYDDRKNEVTSTEVRNWTGIVVRSGKYKLILTKPEKSKWKEDADFDIKVMVY